MRQTGKHVALARGGGARPGGAVGDLANVYIATFQIPGASAALLPNPNTGVVDLLTNGARSNYNAMQVELRRRFANGFTYQANYTFGKLLTNAPATGQTRFEPLIDNNRPQIEYGIGDQDTTHVFNLNAIYELTGTEPMSYLRVAEILSRVLKRDVRAEKEEIGDWRTRAERSERSSRKQSKR